MPRKPIDQAYLELVANKVIELLDKREADKAEKQRQHEREIESIVEQKKIQHEMEIAREIEALCESRRQYTLREDKERAAQAECMHNDKMVHYFNNPTCQKWTKCRDCRKTWKENVTRPETLNYNEYPTTPFWVKPFVKKCIHTHEGKSTIIEIWDNVARCPLCMKTWGKVTL